MSITVIATSSRRARASAVAAAAGPVPMMSALVVTLSASD